MPGDRPTSTVDDVAFFIVVAVGALVAAIWALSDILLLLVGSTLFAVVLHAVAKPLEVRLGISNDQPYRLGHRQRLRFARPRRSPCKCAA